jgi:peroxiredoxin
MLPVGSTAPDFTLPDQNRQFVSLSDFGGDKDVLLIFFPLAFTGICQGELDEVRDHLPDFENDHRAVLAISVGPAPTHKVWATQSGFLFPVLSDFWPHGAVSQTYGVFNDQAGVSNRGTFVIDRSGTIRFAEMKQPGEARDQRLWVDALAALNA